MFTLTTAKFLSALSAEAEELFTCFATELSVLLSDLQVVKDRLLDLLSREEEDESHAEEVVPLHIHFKSFSMWILYNVFQSLFFSVFAKAGETKAWKMSEQLKAF